MQSRRAFLVMAGAAAAAALWPAAAGAAYSAEDLAKLTPEQRKRLSDYQAARTAFNRRLDGYWAEIGDKRAERRRKTGQGLPIVREDYVLAHAPAYSGPPAPDDVFKILRKPPKPPESLPVVADFLRHAREQYGFTPLRIAEDEFMLNYAVEALALGLTRDQVVRVYAFETGGHGTHDMQSGFNPVTKKGRAISSAIGYAQLLHANTTEVMRKHGASYIERLERIAAAQAAGAARAGEIRAKTAAMRKMLHVIAGVADGWNAHIAFGRTPKGQGVHAVNLDGDVGPWLQVRKLENIRQFAADKGWPMLNGAQLEMLNLAGPSRGLEMLQPVAAEAVTANFFERKGYDRNPVVHKRTARELLLKIGEIMERNLQKEGSQRFIAAFDLAARRRAAQR